jgi:hypothetical protein
VKQYELESLWVKSALPRVAYAFDTRVRAIAGDYVGWRGRVVALLSVDPTPLYVVEEPDGTSFDAPEPEWKALTETIVRERSCTSENQMRRLEAIERK